MSLELQAYYCMAYFLFFHLQHVLAKAWLGILGFMMAFTESSSLSIWRLAGGSWVLSYTRYPLNDSMLQRS
jgi:hypothetical protein